MNASSQIVRHDFCVARDDLRNTCLVSAPAGELAEGEARLRVERFALSANNITYAVFGDELGYWNVFPAREGLGRIPAWGFGEVVETRNDAVALGERVYGLLPMSTELVLRPGEATATGFVDGSPHRAGMHPFYNRYLREASVRDRTPDDPFAALMRPLALTAMLIAGFLVDEGVFGSRRVIVSSASSRTAFALGTMLRSLPDPVEVVGLTSSARIEVVRAGRAFDSVLGYDAVDALPLEDAVFVDIAGDASVRLAVHQRLGSALRHSCVVGATHWESRSSQGSLPGPRPVLFFAPAASEKARASWGEEALEERLAYFLDTLRNASGSWLDIVEGKGSIAVTAAYLDLVEGRGDASKGVVLALD